MLNIFEDSKFYVHTPAGIVTGGVELLHQLVSLLRSHGKEAYIVYFGKNEKVIPSDYVKYNIALSDTIEDNDRNIEIYTETMLDDLKNNTRRTQKFLWWLSIDNAFVNVSLDSLSLKEIKTLFPARYLDIFKYRLRRLLHGYNDLRMHSILDPFKHIYCGYQSEYIRCTLLKLGFNRIAALKDYINTDHLKDFDITNRKNIVLYNPAKGYEFTKQLMNITPDLEWVALIGMSRKKLIETMRSAKLYVDFGNHPGKDRLPRECALNGCCIITGKRGSAAYFEDVPIHSIYKFDEKKVSYSDVVARIRWTLKNYDKAIDDFMDYRNIIKNEKKEFELQASDIFHL